MCQKRIGRPHVNVQNKGVGPNDRGKANRIEPYILLVPPLFSVPLTLCLLPLALCLPDIFFTLAPCFMKTPKGTQHTPVEEHVGTGFFVTV